MAKRIIVAVIFVPLLFLVLFFLPPVCTAMLVALIGGIAAFEFLRATEPGLHKGLVGCTVVTAALLPLVLFAVHGEFYGLVAGLFLAAESGRSLVLLLAFLLLVVLFTAAIFLYDAGENCRVEGVLKCFFAGVVIPACLSALVLLRGMVYGRLFVLLPFVIAFLTDGGAYFAGVFLGKHRGITRVSPNKSLEGYIGGLAAGVIFAHIYGLVLQQACGLGVHYLALDLCGFLGALVTEIGDLSFSLIKREYNIKDYGHLLPGHGGMLDRFDSMVFAAPAVYFMLTLFPVL